MTNDEKGRHRSALVWTVHGTDKTFITCDETVFNIGLNARCPDFYGEIKAISKRSVWPLSLSHAHSYIGERMAILADAAHGMHPIAGQGLNIGMRDIDALSELILNAQKKGHDLGSPDLLQIYQSKRRFDTMTMMAATDLLNKLFSNDIPMLGSIRRLGLRLVEHIPPAKQFFMKRAMGK
jgi:2-octaprenyl-6-methoxyphenol hydroxylase